MSKNKIAITTTQLNTNHFILISTYMKYKPDTNGNARYLLSMPDVFIYIEKVRDESPVKLEVANDFIYTYNYHKQNSTAYTIIVTTDNISNTIVSLNNYIIELNQSDTCYV